MLELQVCAYHNQSHIVFSFKNTFKITLLRKINLLIYCCAHALARIHVEFREPAGVSSYNMDSGYGTKGIRLGSKCLYLLSHLISLQCFLRTFFRCSSPSFVDLSLCVHTFSLFCITFVPWIGKMVVTDLHKLILSLLKSAEL